MYKIINNNYVKKVIISILVLLSCSFVMPMYTYALDAGGTVNKYLIPIFLMIPDLLLNKLQNIFIGNNVEFTDPETGDEIHVEVLEDGETAIIKGKVKETNGFIEEVPYGTDRVGTEVNVKDLEETITNTQIDIAQLDPKGGVSNYLIMYSPAVIFSGKVAGLDVNFISPMGLNNEGKVYKNWMQYTYKEINSNIGYDKVAGDKNDLQDYGYYIAQDNGTLVEGTHNSEAEQWVLWFR